MRNYDDKINTEKKPQTTGYKMCKDPLKKNGEKLKK